MTYLSVITGAVALVAVSAVPAQVKTCDMRTPPTPDKSAAKPRPTPMFLSKGRTARA